MNTLLINGCYDSKTLETLKTSGTTEFSFDLRGRSPNLIPVRTLNELIKQVSAPRVFLTFENDRLETIFSLLDLLKNELKTFIPVFRDNQGVAFYQKVPTPFFWLYRPDGDWISILKLPNLKGILLPVKWQSHYEHSASFWNLVDERNIEIYLHAESFDETSKLHLSKEVKLSLDLTPEVEVTYRNIDQDKLKGMKIWRRLNENSAGQ